MIDNGFTRTFGIKHPITCGAAGELDLQAADLVPRGPGSGGRTSGRFMQGPLPGEEADWPFDSDLESDIAEHEEGQCYPKAL